MKKQLFLLVLIVIVTILGYSYLKSTQSQKGNKQTSPNTQPIITTPVWKTYEIKEVHVAFQLPQQYSDVNLQEKIIPGQKGTQICLGQCDNYNSLVRIGTTSSDYQAGRSGAFTDLQGFTTKNGQFYGKFVNGQVIGLPHDAILQIINKNNVSLLRIKGKYNANDGPSLMNSLGDNTFGILINTNDKIYTGLAFAIRLTNGVTEETINQIISSIKFTN